MAGTDDTRSGSEMLGAIDQLVKREFEAGRRLLSFGEYLMLLAERPEAQLRGSARYMVDMIDHFGKKPHFAPGESSAGRAPSTFRYGVFDLPVDGSAPKVVGQEEVQTSIYRTLQSFARQGVNNRLILLHGPNGSAKSTIAHSLMSGLERYSRTDEGAVYTFSWIFPVDKVVKGGIGIQTYPKAGPKLDSYAKLGDEEVAARVPCDLRDHPVFLIPRNQRKQLLESLLGPERAEQVWRSLSNYLQVGDLCHRCKDVFDALLEANGGDYHKVLMHVQVDRYYYSRRYRRGLVTIEPQMHVDAEYHLLALKKGMQALPPSLQSLNLFTLTGDLVDGNRGIIEFSDLLKRPIESYKYLLGACETGSVNVGSTIAQLDTVMIGSTNELQLDGFREMPDFASFKARIELIRVPYLLSLGQEEEIYSLFLGQASVDKHLSPHVAWTLALWAVLSRLKKPNSINYPPNVSSLISGLTPMDKARLYDSGDMPEQLSPEDRKLLKSNLARVRDEYRSIPYYEGRTGASVREIKSIIFDAVQDPESTCLSPLAVLKQLEELVKRVNEYEFLKQDVKDGFHDAPEFINLVRDAYLDRVDREVRDSIALYDSRQWEEFMRRYVQNVSAHLKKEKIRSAVTGRSEDPDRNLISEFEKIVGAPSEKGEVEGFRQAILTRVGAWKLDHPSEEIRYAQVYPEYWARLEKHYYETQKSLLGKMHDALLVYGTEREQSDGEGYRLARQTVANMVSKLGYCESCAKEVITFLMRKRY